LAFGFFLLLAFGFWLLAFGFGFWQVLAFGFWLAAGRWSLVVAGTRARG
jgi:hypothetical protein